MTRRTAVAALLSMLVVCLAAGRAGAQTSGVGGTLAGRVRAYFAAMGRGDIATVEQALAEDYVVIGGDGKLETRAERLAWLRRNVASVAALTPTQLRVRVYGASAVVTGMVVIPADAGAPPVEERFTQVWVRRDRAWRMASAQITIVK